MKVRRVGATLHEVRSCEHDGRPARAVIACRTFFTTAEEVWDALTNAARLPKWFLPISGELCLNGRFQLEGNAGGRITVCEPPRLLAVTWELGGTESWLAIRLVDDGADGIRLELVHSMLTDPEEFWNQFGPGAVGVGWDLAIMGLGQHIATGAVVDPQEAAAWMASDEGQSFVRASSESWRRASIAYGTDEATANAAAKRTTAFYTGASPAVAEV